MKKRSYDVSDQLAESALVVIYAMGCEGFIKIGIAINSQYRLASMQTGNPFPIKLLSEHDVRHEVAALAEAHAHSKLAAFHHRGEWFKCDHKAAAKIIEEAISEAERSWAPGKNRAKFLDQVNAAEAAAKVYQDAYEAEKAREAEAAKAAYLARERGFRDGMQEARRIRGAKLRYQKSMAQN